MCIIFSTISSLRSVQSKCQFKCCGVSVGNKYFSRVYLELGLDRAELSKLFLSKYPTYAVTCTAVLRPIVWEVKRYVLSIDVKFLAKNIVLIYMYKV